MSAVVVSAERDDKRVIGCHDRVITVETELERSKTFAIALSFDADDWRMRVKPSILDFDEKAADRDVFQLCYWDSDWRASHLL